MGIGIPSSVGWRSLVPTMDGVPGGKEARIQIYGKTFQLKL